MLGYLEGQYRVEIGDGGIETAMPMVDAGARLLTADGRPAPAPAKILLQDLREEVRDRGPRRGTPRLLAPIAN